MIVIRIVPLPRRRQFTPLSATTRMARGVIELPLCSIQLQQIHVRSYMSAPIHTLYSQYGVPPLDFHMSRILSLTSLAPGLRFALGVQLDCIRVQREHVVLVKPLSQAVADSGKSGLRPSRIRRCRR